MKKITLQHVLGNKILEYDVDDRGVIIDEREKDRYAKQQDSKENLMSNWIKEHISFYYDMSKPMDVYHTNFTKWVKGPIGNAIGKQTENEIILNGRRNEGDTTLGYLVTDKSLFLTKGDLIKIEGASNEAKIKVIVRKKDDQWVNAFNGTDEIVSDGIYEFSLTPINYKGIQIEITGVTTYSNLKMTLLPSGKSVPSNEILKVSGYLQDLSGRKRNMKLNNFLFDMMSGIGKDNSLVTDGVDDYGLVENLSSGVKMLFMTVNPIGDFNISKMYYSQRKDPIKYSPFYIFTGGGSSIAYPGNQDGVTYINGVLNKSIKVNELFGVKHIITTVNANVKPETSKAPSFFWEEGNTKNYCSKLAFYNSIAFDSIPTEADGFTEQELIDYVIDKYELK